ncbi:adhesion G-protein coupled receptor G1-like [Neolamprologus brichardi]|uniref:adhesion G-protein coupled receptor G1-like n=1 Tax=Neolamprologus brichardi TaxID=32507 RepID=UPI001643EDF9|nr:adhesion G-protein coupled receptor G1-like [Neolamprologus brichardi]
MEEPLDCVLATTETFDSEGTPADGWAVANLCTVLETFCLAAVERLQTPEFEEKSSGSSPQACVWFWAITGNGGSNPLLIIISAYRNALSDGILALFCREWKKAIAEDALNTDAGVLYDAYDRRLVILSAGKPISGLQDPVNITINFKDINKTQKPSCQFFNFSTNNFSTDGCLTRWTDGQSDVTCSCNHFTYFGILMVETSPSAHVSKEEIEILAYISVIGCSVSLFTLIITVLLFITNRTLRKDVSMNIHINLVIALILLNLHFLPSQAVAAYPSTWLCFYMALALHYSLLATFTWMALEGFHLYLLLVKIFNISVSRYILKLSVVGWGVPAVIVSVVVIIDRGFYGQVPLDRLNYDDMKICFITNQMVKMVTTMGLFPFVFLFNMLMFAVTVKRVFCVGQKKEVGHAWNTQEASCQIPLSP